MTNILHTLFVIYASKASVCDEVIHANHSLLTARALVTSSQIIFYHRIHV